MTESVRHMSGCEKPREKFLQMGSSALTDQDLLAILLRTGVKGHSVLDVSRDMIRSLPDEDLSYLGEISVAELRLIRGVGNDKAVTICAAVELGKRISRLHVKRTKPDFGSPKAIADYVMEDMRFLQQERFSAAYLSTKNQLISFQTLTIGSLNASIAQARDVFRHAIRCNAAAVILLHNHPSGDPEPSREDISVTQRIAEAGRIMEIPVLDHIIIGDGNFVSLCERGYI